MASFTRANVEADLVDAYGTLMARVAKDGTTVSGSNASLNAPLLEGFRSLGRSPLSPAALTDADLATVPDLSYPQLRDVAALTLLRSCRLSPVFFDQNASGNSRSFSQVRAAIDSAIVDLEAKCKNVYGYGLGSITAGGVSLGYLACDWPDDEGGWCP